jgi:DNA-binding transcriptional LysR family regulator
MSKDAQLKLASEDHLAQTAPMNRTQAPRAPQPAVAGAGTPQALELRHLRYLVALADAGSFTRAAERIFIAQPTLSQQIRRLEEIVGMPLLQRRPEGLRLTPAGRVLLDGSRNVLSLVDHAVNRTRHAAGLGRPRLRVVMPPGLPESLAVPASAGLHRTAAAADVDLAWLEATLDAEFSLIGTRQADAGLGWLAASQTTVPAALEVMTLGEFEPEVWVPPAHPAAHRGTVSLHELTGLQVFHGPRGAQPGTYDAWLTAMRAVNPRFGFTDPPFRHSPGMTLALAAAGSRPAAVLTGPLIAAPSRTQPSPAQPSRRSRLADTYGMARVVLQRHPLTAAAALVWSSNLPRPLQQMLFDIADRLTDPAHPLSPGPANVNHARQAGVSTSGGP